MILRRGSVGDGVRALQRALNAATDAGLVVDGRFGEATEQAVVVYQFGRGLTRDGIAGPVTLGALGLVAVDRAEPLPRSLVPIPAGWLLGLDTSQFQGTIDPVGLVQAGVSFLYARATDGEHSIDRGWEDTAASCLDAGLPLGAYGVLEPYGVARARGQARHFVAQVKGRTSLPPALDFELAGGISALAALESAVVWCDEVEQALGRRAIVYTGPAFFELLDSYAGPAGDAAAESLASRPLWVAHYTQDHARLPRAPRPWTDWAIWQASGGRRASRNAATLPGTRIEVDVDFFRGTLGQLVALGDMPAPA